MKFIYLTGWIITRVVAKLIFRLKIINKENFVSGRILIAPNHTSYVDPPIVGCSVPKELYYMAKKELFESKIMGFLLRKTNAFPVEREKIDPSTIKTAVKILKSNKPLVLFPEGTRRKFFCGENIKNGFVKIAKIANADILPVAIINTNNLKFFKQIKVVFGKKISCSLGEKEILETYISEMEKMLKKYG